MNQSFQWMKQAAEQGHTQAQVHLADMYYNGEGTDPDVHKSLYWMKQAAWQGYDAYNGWFALTHE